MFHAPLSPTPKVPSPPGLALSRGGPLLENLGVVGFLFLMFKGSYFTLFTHIPLCIEIYKVSTIEKKSLGAGRKTSVVPCSKEERNERK